MLDDETHTWHIVNHTQNKDLEPTDLISVHRLNLFAECPIFDFLCIEYFWYCKNLDAVLCHFREKLGMVVMLM